MSHLVLGQENSGVYYEISNLFHKRAKVLTCEFVETSLNEIKKKSESEIKEELIQGAEMIEGLKVHATDDLVKQEISDLSQRLKESAHERSLKEKFTKVLENLCRLTVKPMVFLSRGISLGNSALINTAFFPLSGFVSFWNGYFSRKKNELGSRDDLIFRVVGPEKSIPGYLLGMISSEAVNLIITNNPSVSFLNASVAIEMLTNYRCFHVNRENSKQVKFCKDYSELRDFFHKGNQKIWSYGQKFQNLVDERIIEKRKDFSVEKYCAFSKKRQVKMAKDVLLRHSHLLQDARIQDLNVILPVHKNSCTKILISAKDEKSFSSIKNERAHLEGIELVFKLKEDNLKEYYFSKEELKIMDPEDSLCHEAEVVYYNRFLTSKLSLVQDFLKSTLAPSMLATPETQKVIMADSLIRQGEVRKLRNLIFSLAPADDEDKKAISLNEERKLLVKDIKKDYKKIANSGAHIDCTRIIKKRKIEVVRFQEDLARISAIAQDNMVKKKLEFDVLKKYFQREKNKLKLEWELVKTNDIRTVTEMLQSDDIANVVIIAHGKSSGHLVDRQDQEFPREAFSFISPKIQSLNFYSCHSKKLINLYSLKIKMSSAPSLYKIRYLTNVAENDFIGSDSYAPITAFGHYLYILDGYLWRSTKGAQLMQENFGHEFKLNESEKMCLLDAQEVLIEKGAYALILNNQMIGTIDEFNQNRGIKFPCSLLKVSNNILKLKNIKINPGSSVINMAKFRILLQETIIEANKAFFKDNNLIIFKF